MESAAEESGNQLDGLLKSFESEGEAAGEGSFSLDPRRALTMLRSQGRLSEAGPLFLASAIYQHTEGSPIARKTSLTGQHFSWPEQYGPLPETVERILAQEAFLGRQIKLEWSAQGLTMKNAERFRPGVTERIEELFSAVRDRLHYYPWADQELTPYERATENILKEREFPQGTLLLREPHHPRTTICWVVHGIAHREHWSLPVDGLVFDDSLRPDISFSVIPESTRKQKWLEDARSLLLESLGRSLREEGPFHLTAEETQDDPMFLRYLPFVLGQVQEPEMAEEAREQVFFPDIFDQDWSLGSLQESYQRYGRLLVVPTVPEELSQRKADRPILWWRGQAKRLGQRVFPQVFSGAGYLYSLRQNEREKVRVSSEREQELASVPLEDGQLSLLSWSEEDRPAEVLMVGIRRAAETFYLDDQAPTGLRLLWECEREVGEHSPESMFGKELRIRVLELFDRSLAKEPLQAQRLVSTLLWALSPGEEMDPEWEALKDSPLLPDVRQNELSYNQLRDLEAEREGLPTLEDLSTSLPEELPGGVILWWNPLLDHLKFRCREMGRQVREAHWKEEGRAKWLERYPSQPPKLEGDSVLEIDGHLVERTNEDCTELTIWREGRPLGKRRLTESQCPEGFRVIWVDDEFPADRYWSGPDPTALRDLYPALGQLCQSASAGLE